MVRRWHADPFGFLRPWNEVPALMGSAPPATPPSTGTGVVTFLMGWRRRPGQWLSSLWERLCEVAGRGPQSCGLMRCCRMRLRGRRGVIGRLDEALEPQ